MRVAERDVVAYLAHLPKATPLAQKIAASAGVDLAGLTGTGPAGRITRGDVEARDSASRRSSGCRPGTRTACRAGP